jgi:general secretion pathway protein J
VRRSIASSRCAGFTLVEALLATLLMSVIMAALATVTAQWLPSWDRGIMRLQRIETLALGLDRIVADISSAEFVSVGTSSTAGPIFEGDELSVIFARTTLAPNAATSLEIVRLAEASDERGLVLVRSTAEYPPRSGGSRAIDGLLFSNPVAMIRAPYRVAFSYAGPDRAWRDSWRGQAELPRAVRVRLRDIATSTTLAVSTSTMVHAELPARCTYATTVADCPILAAAGSTTGASGPETIGTDSLGSR